MSELTVKVEMDDTVRGLLEQANAELAALRQRAETAERERDTARAQVAALREALQNIMGWAAGYSRHESHLPRCWAKAAALAADATQAGERWRAMERVCRRASAYTDLCRRGAQAGESEYQLMLAVDDLAALGEEGKE